MWNAPAFAKLAKSLSEGFHTGISADGLSLFRSLSFLPRAWEDGIQSFHFTSFSQLWKLAPKPIVPAGRGSRCCFHIVPAICLCCVTLLRARRPVFVLRFCGAEGSWLKEETLGLCLMDTLTGQCWRFVALTLTDSGLCLRGNASVTL